MIGVFLVLAALALLVIGAVVWQFGHPALDNYRSRCPKCGAQALLRLDSERAHEHRLRTFSCRQCGAGFREQLDGTLSEL